MIAITSPSPEKKLLKTRTRQHDVDRHAGAGVKEWQHTGLRHERVDIANTQPKARFLEGADQLGRLPVAEQHRDVQVGGEPRGSVQQRRLCTEQIPGRVQLRQRPGERRERLSER